MLKPTEDRVVVRRDEALQQTTGGILLPDNVKKRPAKGTVVACGPGKKDEPMAVAVGDRVLFDKYSGVEVESDGEELLIMRDDDILAVDP